MTSPSADLSVVIPVFNAESSIAGVVDGLVSAFYGRGTLQVVLVNDGSSDGSHGACSRLAAGRPETVGYLRLAKNFGEHNAVMAGLDLVDLINLRDALQQEIDNFALTALEAQAMISDGGEELMP